MNFRFRVTSYEFEFIVAGLLSKNVNVINDVILCVKNLALNLFLIYVVLHHSRGL